MRIIHCSDGWGTGNGVAVVARLIATEQKDGGKEVSLRRWAFPWTLHFSDQIWVHCGWRPCLWWAALWGRDVHWMPAGCYDPVRLKFHGWKKKLVGMIERFFLRRVSVVVATCSAEADWIRAYEPRVKRVEVTDIRHFFQLDTKPTKKSKVCQQDGSSPSIGAPIHLLYLGRRHPLKGLEYLERALEKCGNVKLWNCEDIGMTSGGECGILFRAESNVFGDEKERVWEWCDVLVLPTLSENFGLVVAEALERGKRVVVTDGAPAWNPDNTGDYDGRLMYLRGYRDGTPEERVDILVGALKHIAYNFGPLEAAVTSEG